MLAISPDPAQTRRIDRKRMTGVEDLVPVPDMIDAIGNLLAVGDNEAADGLFQVLGGVPVQQGNGSGEAVRHEEVVTMGCQ